MSCFCRQTFAAISQAAAAAAPSPPREPPEPPDEEQEAVPGQATAKALNEWLVRNNRLAPVWRPKPEWIETPLPELPPGYAVSIAALHSVVTTLTNVIGPEVTQPEGQTALARMVATLDERMQEQEGREQEQKQQAEKLRKWQELAESTVAAQRIIQGVESRAFTPTEEELEEDEAPADLPAEKWEPFLNRIGPLAPVLRILSIRLKISDILRVTQIIRAAPLPEIKPERLIRAVQMAQGVNALAQLRDAVGLDPVEAGYEEVRQAVAKQVRQAAQAYKETEAPRDPRKLRELPVRPSITETMVQVARQMVIEHHEVSIEQEKLTEFLRTIVPVTTLAAATKRALGEPPAPRPCGRQCDARQALAARQHAPSVPAEPTSAA